MTSKVCPLTLRLDTDGRFFVICDSDEEYPWDNFALENIKEQKGIVTSHNAVMVSTFAQLSNARVDFTIADTPPEFPKADQIFDIEIETESGCVTIFGGPTAVHSPTSLNVPSDTTNFRIARFNTGEQGEKSYELDNEAFLSHLEWERYEICIIAQNA